VERLATIDADLAAFIFSAHGVDCGEPSLRLAKVPPHPGPPAPFPRSQPVFSPPHPLFRST
jgi:hypothetical protein